jgi:hypothetical protein
MRTASFIFYGLAGLADSAAGDGFLANSTTILPSLKLPYKG